ncbi:protein AHNAK2 isoform X2 [Melanerpes formicivorus]|uniref:protein AHNAK2 isoform X2 n=1 Tax=Melanerpes formicivorus TaxID=211600 RepID=UPI00358F7F24
MEVTLKTEVEAGASGFSVMGGGNEGIFIKKVLKESPASKIFSLREGDQLLSATIFFDNIKYEDALKILQYSEPYRVQFSLKRKIAGKEEPEDIQSTAQYKKERISQEREHGERIPEETLHIAGKAISEEDRETLIVSQRVGRSKRPKKDRLSWPKFQSIKNKKILGHRRSHSTSDAYESAMQDISPTSTDTESQFQQEVHIKGKKRSHKKLKFPNIGFKMHRSKPEPQDKQKKEIKTTLLHEKEKIDREDMSLENPEILTVEYTTSPAYEITTGETHETLTKEFKDMKNVIISHAKKCPEVEMHIKTDKESTSKFTLSEEPAVTPQIPKPSLETAELKDSPTKQMLPGSSKSRKKKQKGTEGGSGINIHVMGHTSQESMEQKDLEIGTAKAELHTTSNTLEKEKKQAEGDTQKITIQKPKFGISMSKKKEHEVENTKLESDVPHSAPEKTADTSSEKGKNLDVKPQMTDAQTEISTWKIQMPSFKIPKMQKPDTKLEAEESTAGMLEPVKKEQIEDGIIKREEKFIAEKTGEKDTEGKESKFRLPKFKLPAFTWAKDGTGQIEGQKSDKEGTIQFTEEDTKPDKSILVEEEKITGTENELRISKQKINEKEIKQNTVEQTPSQKKLNEKPISTDSNLQDMEERLLITKPDIKIKMGKFSMAPRDSEESKNTEENIKAPKVDITMHDTETSLILEDEEMIMEKEPGKTKDGKFKMPKFGMPSFGWSSSREAKGSAAADADVSLKEPQVTVASGSAEVDVTLPGAEIQAPDVEVTVETAAGADGEKGRFKMPSVKLPKVKAPHVQVSLPKAEGSAPKAQAEVQEGEVALQAPDVEGGLEVAAGKVEGGGGGMKLHMPKVKVPSVVFSKPAVKAPKLDADVSLPKVDASLPEADLKAGAGDISITAPDVKLPSVEGSLELQAPETDLKAASAEASLDGAKLEATGLKGKLKMPKFDKPKFGVSLPKAEGPEGEGSLPTVEVDLPSATVMAAGEGPALGLKADVPGAKTDGDGWKLEKPSLKMPKADIKAPKVDISLPSVDVSLPKASVDLQAPEATLSLEGEAKTPEKEPGKTKDGKFKMPKFGMPSFGWSSSREAKGSAAADADVSLKEPQVTVASGSAEVDVTLPGAEIQAPGVEVTVETAAGADGEKGRFKMPSVKLPKVKAPHVQVSLPKAEGSAPKAQAEVQEGEVALQAPDVEGGLEVAAGKVEGGGGGMKLHMPKVKVPSVVFSKPAVKAPKLDADVSLPKVDASLPEADLKAGAGDISITAPDVKLPSVEGSLELQAPETDLKAASAEASLDGAKLEATGLKGKLKMPKFDKPKFGVSLPKAEGPEGEGSLPTVEVDLPSATVTAAGEGPALGLKADVPGAKTDGDGWKLEKPSLKMPKADIKAPKVDISLPSVDVSLPKASVDLQAPEATLSLEGEAKTPEKEPGKTKDGKFKMPKFGMPSFGWSSSREAKGSAAADADVSLKEPQVTVASGSAEVDVTLPGAEIQAPDVEVTVETAAGADGEKGRFKMPSVKLPKVKAPHVQVSLPKAEGSAPKAQAEVQEGEVALQAPDVEGGLEVAAGKVEGGGGGMKLHMPKVKVPSVVFSKPAVKAPKLDADVSLPKVDASLPEADLKAGAGDISITAPDVKLPSVEGSLELQAPETDLKAASAEASLDGAKLEATGLKGKLKMPKFDKPKFGVSLPKAEGPEGEGSLPTVEVDLPSATVTAAGEGPALGLKADVPGAKTDGDGWKLEKPSLKMPKADIKAPKVDISLPSVDVSLPKASVDLQAPEATLSLEGEAKTPEKEPGKTKDGKFKMPKFGMPSFGWSSSREAKGSAAADADVSLKEPQVTVASGSAEVDVTLPGAEIQAPGVEVTVETAAGADGEKGRFKMPSVKLPKVKAPHVQVSLPKAEGSAPKAQVEVQEGEVALQAPDVEGGLEVAAGKVEGGGGGMKLHMPKVKVPSVVFSKPAVKAPKLDADVSLPKVDASLPEADLKAGAGDISITAPDVKLPSVEGSLELQAPETDLKAASAEASLDGAKLEATGLKGKLKMPKFDKPKFGVSLPKAEGPEGEGSLPTVEVDLPSATVTAAGEGPALGLKADVPGAKTDGDGWKLEKPSLKMPKADIKAPKVDISLPSVDVSLPNASVDLQAPEATLSLEGEAKTPEKEPGKTKDGKFKMPKFGMPSFGWSSSREAKGSAAADADVSLKEPQVTVASGSAEVDVTLPGAEIQAPDVEVTVETAAGADGEKGRFKMPSVKLPKVKAPHVQVSLPKAEGSAPKAQAEVQEGEVALQAPDVEGGLEVAAGKVEGGGGGMKLHMPKVKVPSVVFSKPAVKAPKLDADVSLPKVDASLPEADLKAGAGDISITAPDVKLPSVEGSLELQAPETDLKAASAEASLDGAKLEATGLKGKLKMPKFDKPKFGVSLPKAEGPEGEGSLPTVEVDLPSATVTAAGEGPALGLKADVPGAKTDGDGWKLEKPSLKMPKADIKAPKVDISLPSVDVTLPKASVDLQAPEATLSLEGEAKTPEKEPGKTKDGKFKMPKFGMPSFGWSSSREAKGSAAADADVSLKEPQVTVASGSAEVDVTLPGAEIQAPDVEVTVETAAGADGEKGRFKMPSVKLPKVKAPHVQVSLPKAEGSAPKAQAEVQEGEVALQAPDVEGGLEVAAGKVEGGGGGMKLHMPKVKVPSVVFSKPAVKAPKLDADVSLPKVDASLPEADLKAGAGDISITAPDVKLPSVEGSLELQAPETDLKAASAEASLDGAKLEATGLKGKLKMPKFDKPKFGVSLPKAEGPEGEGSLPTVEVDLPSATVTAAGEGPALGLKADVPGAKTDGDGWKLEKPSLKMPKADIKAPKVDISLPSVDVSLPKASVDLQAPEATLSLEGEAKTPEKEPGKTKDGKFKMPKFGMPSFGWSSSREAKGSAAADADVSLKEPQVTVASGSAEVDVTLPGAEIQAPGVEVTVETAAGADGEKGRFKMPSVKLPKVKAPHVQVSLPKAEGSAPKAQAEVQEGEVALQAPDVEGGLEVAAGKVEGGGGGMKLHMPKVKVPSVVFSKPAVKAPKLDADVSLPKVDASLPEADLKAGAGDISITAPDVKLPSVEGSLELQAPETDLKAASAEASLDGAKLEATGLKGKLKMPKFDKPKFGVSLPKAEGPEGEGSLPTVEVDLPSATVTAAGEGPALGLKADVPGAKTDGDGWKLEKPSLKMPKADIKAPKVDISLPSVDVSLPKASVDLQAPEATLSLEGEAKTPEKEPGKTKDGKFKMPKFGMPSFGWSSSREAKGSAAADADVSLKEPQVTVASGSAEVDVTLPGAEIQAPGVEVTVETAAGADGEKGRFKMPSVKLPKVKAPHVQVSLPKAEGSAPKAQAEVQEGEVALQAPDVEGGLEVAAGKVEGGGGGMKLHMPKVKVPSVVFSKPAVKAPKLDADVSLPKVDASLPEADLKAGAGGISITAPDVKLPSVEGSLELQAPETDLKAASAEASLDGAKLEATGLKGKLKMPKFDKPKFGVSLPKAEGPEGEGSLPTVEVDLPSATVTAAGEGPALGLKADVPGAKTDGDGWKLEKPSLKMPKADIKAPKVDISLPSVDVTLPKASVDLQAPEATLSLEGEAKTPEKEPGKTKDGKFKMPKFGMPSFGWSSSREAKGSAAADADVSLKEPQVTVASGSAEVDVTLPGAEIQAPGVEVTVETAAGADGEKGRFKMPSVKLPKVKAPHVQVSLPKAEGSAPKAQAEVQEGEVALQAPDVEGGLEVAAGKVEGGGGGMKLHMPKVKVPSVVFSKPAVKAPKLDADVSLPKVDASLPEADLKAGAGDISITAPDVKLPSVEGSLELQAPETDLKAASAEASLDGAKLEATGLKGKLKMPKFDKPKFGVSLPKAEGPEGEGSLPTVEVDLPSATVTAAGEGPALGLKADVPGAKTDGDGWKLEKPSLKMPKADIKAPKVDISLPSVDVSLPKASVDLQAPEATLSLEGEAKTPEKEPGKTKDGKFKMPKFGMPSFGWSSSREAKGSAAADADVSLKEPQVTVASGSAEVDVTLPGAEIQAPDVEVTIETAAGADGEKGRFKMPSVKLPKVKAPHVQVSLPKAEGSAPKAQAEVQEGEVALQAPDVEGGLEVAAGKVEGGGGGMKLHMPKVKVPSVVFSKPAVKAPKLDADVSLPKVDASLPEADLKAGAGDISITAPDVKLPSVEGSLELQAPETDLKAASAEASLDGAKLEATGLKGKLKMPKFDKPKFGVSLPKAEGPEGEGSLPTVEVDLPSATVTAAGEGPALGLKADVPGAKTDGDGWKLEKPSLKMPKADIKAPKVDISLPSVDVSLPKASVDLQAPEATLSLEGEAKTPEKEPGKTKDGKFKMPKFGMPSFGWSSSREAKGSAAADADVSLKEPQVTVASGSAEVDVTLPGAEIQAPGVEVTVETAAGADGEKGRFKMPSVKLPKVKAPHVQVSLPKAEGSAPKAQAEVQEGEVALQAPDVEGGLEVAAGKVEGGGGGMKLHMPKVKVPSVVFSKPAVKAPKLDADVSLPKVDASLPEADLKAGAGDISITAPDVKLPSVEGSLELQAPETDLKAASAEASLDGAKLEATGLKGKLKMPKFDKPKFGVSLPKAEGPEGEGSLPTVEVDLPSATVTAAGEGPALGLKADVPGAKTDGDGWKLEKPSLKMPKADIKAPKVDISLPSVDVSLPKASVDLQAPEATLSLEGEAKTPEKEPGKTKDGKFKMPKFGMPSFGWSSSREAKGSAAADADVSLKEPQVTVASGSAEVDVTLPGAEIQAPGVEVTVETAAGADGEKGRFKMPSVKLPKVKAPHVQVSLPKAEGSAPKAQAEVQEGEVALQAPDVEGGLEVAAGKVEGGGGGMKLHMPKVKVPSVVFSKPAVKAPKLDADVSLPKVDASLPEADLKAGAGDISITAPDVKLPSVEGSLELQAPETDLKAASAEASLDGAKLEATGLKGKLKMPKFDKPKFGVSLPKAEGPEGEGSLPTVEVDLPSATVTAAGEGPALGLKADVPGAKTDGDGWKLEKPSLKMPKADIKAPKVDISLPSVDVSLPKASVDLQAPEATLSLEGEAKTLEKEPGKTKDGKFKMPKFGMPSFGWSSSREAKGSAAADADVSLKEPQVTVASGSAEVDVTLPGAEIQAPGVEVTVETAAGADGEKGRFKMPSVKLPKVKAPHVQVSLPKAEGSAPKAQAEVQEGEVALQAPDVEGGLEVAAGKVEGGGGGMKLHMPKVKVPSVVFSKPAVKAPKLDADVSLPKVDASLPEADLKAGAGDISITAPDVKLPSVEGSLELQAPETDLKAASAEASLDGAKLEATGLKGKLKMPKFDKPKFGVSLPKAEGPEGEGSLPTVEVDLPSATVTAAGEGPALGLKADVPGAKTDGDGWKLEKPSLKMPKADIKAPKVDISLPSVDVSLPKASVDLQAPEATLSLEGEAKTPEKEPGKTKDGKFKMPKFGMPSFGWSSSREAKGSAAADADVSLKEPQVTVASGSAEVDVTLPGAEIHSPAFEFAAHSSYEKDCDITKDAGILKDHDSVEHETLKLGGKTSITETCVSDSEVTVKIPKFRKPKFGFSWSKGKQSESDVVCQVEREVSEGKVTSDMTYKPTQVSDAEFDVTIQKPSPEVFSPKLDVSVSSVEVVMPKLEVGGHYPECMAEQEVVSGEMHTEEKENKFKTSKFKLPSLSWSPKKAAIALSEAEVHIEEPTVSTLSGYREAELTSAEKTSSGIPLGDVEIKSEGPEGKTKMSKFQMPKFGITHFKGKGSEKEVRQSKSEVMFPQLKAMVDIADIAVDAPNLEVECGARAETDSLKVKMTKADEKAPEPDVHIPSADISILKPDSDIQDSDASLKIKGEAKQDGDGEEKEGHFKMPKFKLPSFSWSPKKESSVKPDSEATLEDHKLAIMSSTADIEVKGAATDDKGTGPSLDLEVSAGKVEQKSPIKKTQFAMPKISLSKIKVPKSQSYSPKVEADATTPKTEKESVDSIQIPDIERSHSVRTEEGAQISIKLADVKIPSLEFSKIETEAPQNEMGVSSAQIDAAQPPSEASFQQVVVLKSSSTNEDTIQKPGMKFPKGEAVGELRSPEIVTESSLVVDGRKNKLEGPEGKIKMPKFQKPKFGISLTKGKGSETEVRSPKPEAEFPQMKMTNEVANITVGVPASELTSDVSDSGVGTCKIKAPQFLTAGIEASEVDVSSQSVSKPVTEGVIESLEEKEIVVKEEHEIKAEEFQTEEHQGWFKMPKFRIPAFGRTSSKEKKSDVDIERSTVKAQLGIPSAKVQTETSIPEKTLPRTVAEITIEKQEIPKSDSVKSSDVSSSVVKGGISVSTERTDIVNIAKPETYAEVVKHDAEGQKMHTSEFTVASAELSKSYLSASEIHKDDSLTNRFPLCTLTLQEHKAKSQYTEIPKIECSTKSETSGVGCKLSSGEITLDATEDKIDSSLPKGKLDIQNQEAIIRKGKVKGEMKIIAEDSEGRQLKRPASEWSTMKGSEDGGFVKAKMEVVKVEVSGVKMDVKMARVDPEKKFQVKSVERDTSARVGVQVEDKAESKIKTYKFKIPTFGVLHSEVKDLEDDTNLQNLEAVSVSKTQIGTAETQFQKSEGSIILKSPSLDHMEASARTTVETLDKSQDGPDVNINIPKLKIPKFTFKALPIEADISMSKVVTDPKGSSADIEVVKLQATSAIPEETPEVLEGGIQKAKSKILTLTEPDIKTAQVTTNARQDIHWSYVEGQEISEKVEPEHVAIERCEIYTTEILKESEVLSSEVKTATLGFSLIKAKLPESHSNSEVLVQQPSPTEDLTVSKPICADENFRVAAQTSSAEPKLSDKPHTEAKEFSGEVSLPKLKEFDVEVKLSSKVEESLPKVPEGVTASPFSKGEDVAEALDDEEKDIIDEKEKTDSKRSPGRFKFWLPNIGFSSPSDETSINSKTVVKKSVPEDVRPADMPDNDSSKPAEKTGWFRFPKLGFSSPTKKVKTADREQVDHKEGRISDEDSPSDKPDVFFDAQESLSPKEITESKSIETDGASSSVPVSRTIVTSSARTELILLEEEKDSQSNIPGLPAK